MPEPLSRRDLFLDRGWLFVTAREYPRLRDTPLVQRFRSPCGRWIHEVRSEDGLVCSCPGWRKRDRCSHGSFVLRWNVSGSEIGRFLTRLPNEDDALFCGRNGSWAEWFQSHVAVVPSSLARRIRVEAPPQNKASVHPVLPPPPMRRPPGGGPGRPDLLGSRILVANFQIPIFPSERRDGRARHHKP
jgi:hypothetical protein